MIAWTGRKTVEGVAYAADILFLSYLAFKELISPARRGRHEALRGIARQILFTGVDALPVVSAIALMLGLIVIIQAGIALPQVGAGAFLANIVVVALVRELGPLLTAFIVVGRSGTAMCTELGNMRVGQEIDGLEAMGISVVRFLVMPRMVGAIVAIICLAVYFDLVAVIGGFLVAKVSLTIPFLVYLGEIEQALSIAERLCAREELRDERLVFDFGPRAVARHADKELVAIVAKAIAEGDAVKIFSPLHCMYSVGCILSCDWRNQE